MYQLKYKLKTFPIITALLVLSNIVIYILEETAFPQLFVYGGLQKTMVLDYHQYGRMLSAMFFHAGIEHLFNNMIILLFLGSMLEKEFGHLVFGVVYFLAGIGGNILSLFYKVKMHSEIISIGASGAVFGLDGLLLAASILSPEFREKMDPRRIILMIVLSLYEGYRDYYVDNAAHLGGLATGFILGILIVSWQNAQKAR